MWSRKRSGKDPLENLKAALKNVSLRLKTNARRIGGANYQVPIEVRPERQMALGHALDHRLSASDQRRPWVEKLAGELIDARPPR